MVFASRYRFAWDGLFVYSEGFLLLRRGSATRLGFLWGFCGVSVVWLHYPSEGFLCYIEISYYSVPMNLFYISEYLVR